MEKKKSLSRKTGGTLLLFLVTSLLFGAPGDSSDLLRADIHSLAEKIALFLQGEHQTTIAVGNFSAPPALMASFGSGIKKTLIEELEKIGIVVDRKSPLVVKGDYGLSYNEKGPKQGYIFGRVMRASDGQILFQFRQPVTDPIAREQMVGGTVEFEAPPSRVRPSVLPNPQAAGSPTESEPIIVEERVQPVERSPYSIQLLVNGEPVRPVLMDGLPFVDLARGAKYQVRLRNESECDAAVRLTIDGLSMFAFNTTGQDLKHVIVPKGKTVTVPGWFFTYDETREFEVTSYPESAVAILGAPEDEVGMVTATFAAAWDPNDPESIPFDERTHLKGGLATGVGDRLTVHYKKKQYVIGKIRSVITVRYLRRADD